MLRVKHVPQALFRCMPSLQAKAHDGAVTFQCVRTWCVSGEDHCRA